jgi:hypothetical protein
MFVSAMASIALVYRWNTHAGGFVGAAYVGLFVTQPLELLQIAILSLATYMIITRLLAPRMILFGRRKFALTLLVASILTWAALLLRDHLSGAATLALSSPFALIHLTLTGLFANDFERVGIRRVAVGTSLAVAFTLSTTLWVVEVFSAGRLEVALPLMAASFAACAILFGSPLQALIRSLSVPHGHLDAFVRPVDDLGHVALTGGPGKLLGGLPVRRVVVPVSITLSALLIGFSPLWREAPLILHAFQSDETGPYAPHVVAPSHERSPDRELDRVERAMHPLNGRQSPAPPRTLALRGQGAPALPGGELQ